MKAFRRILAVVVVLALLYVVTPVVLSWNRTVYVVTVVDMTDDRVYVYDGKKTWALENTDRWYLEKDSTAISDRLQVGYSFMVDVAGYQVPVLGFYENIVHVDGIGR